MRCGGALFIVSVHSEYWAGSSMHRERLKEGGGALWSVMCRSPRIVDEECAVGAEGAWVDGGCALSFVAVLVHVIRQHQ